MSEDITSRMTTVPGECQDTNDDSDHTRKCPENSECLERISLTAILWVMNYLHPTMGAICFPVTIPD